MDKLRKNKRLIIWVWLIVSILTPLLQVKVEAHNAVFLSSVIDTVNKKYVVDVVEDKPGFSKESSHAEAKLGNFATDDYNLISSVGDPMRPFRNSITWEKARAVEVKGGSKTGDNSPLDPEKDEVEVKVFTFPTTQEDGNTLFGSKNHATSEDTDRAFNIGRELSASLNGLLAFVNGGRGYKNVEHLILTSIYLRPQGGGKAGNTVYVPGPNNSEYKIVYEGSKNFDDDGNLKATATKIKENGKSVESQKEQPEEFTFIYAMPKGYVPVPTKYDKGGKEPLIKGPNEIYEFAKKAKEKGGTSDTAWITIHHLTAQANYAHTRGITYQTGKPEESLGFFTRVVKTFLVDLLYGLMNLLGLYNVEDLIYNKGVQSSGMYSNGLMNSEWWKVVVRYHMIAQALAFVILVGAIVKTLIQVNYSTINPALRMYLYQIFERMFAVGVLLVGIIPITLMMTGLNNALVDLFATQVDLSSTGRFLTHGGLISGVIIEFAYFAITFYMNFVYIVRSMVIALLIASAPLFIVSMAFTYKTRGLFDIFFKELVANIFLQSFHAFAFAFIFNLQATGRGIESLVSIAILIPLTEFFREVIFGHAGGGTIGVGKNTAQVTQAGVKSVGRGAKAAVAGAVVGGVMNENASAGDLNDTSQQSTSGYTAAGNFHKSASGNKGGGPNVGEAMGSAVIAEGQQKRNLKKEENIAMGKKGAGLAGLGTMATGAAVKGLGKAGTAGQGLSDAVDGLAYGNTRMAMKGAQDMGASMGDMIGDGAVGLGAMASGMLGETLDDKDMDTNPDNINPIVGLSQNPDGSTTFALSGDKLNAMGASQFAISKGKDNKPSGLSFTYDAAKAGIAGKDANGKPVYTQSGKNFSKLVAMSQTQQGREQLQKMGVSGIKSIGEGKYRMNMNENFMKKNQIAAMQKAPGNDNMNITKAAGANPTTSFIPQVKDSDLQAADLKTHGAISPEQLISGGKNAPSVISKDHDTQNKWQDFSANLGTLDPNASKSTSIPDRDGNPKIPGGGQSVVNTHSPLKDFNTGVKPVKNQNTNTNTNTNIGKNQTHKEIDLNKKNIGGKGDNRFDGSKRPPK